MSGEELGNLITKSFINGLIQGAIIMAPYIIGFCVLCVIIGLVKKKFRKKKQTILCPKCGAPMILRTASKGENQGKQFYGCSNFPKCREIINIAEMNKTK